MSTVVENEPQGVESTDLPEIPRGFEFVDGKFVERNVSLESSWVGGQIFLRLATHTKATGVGWTFPPETGCQCFADEPRQLRKPDTLFVKADRMGWEDISDGWLRIAPDLVVEVVCPNDKARDVELKITTYLQAGVPLIWVIYPEVRTVRILRGDGSTAMLREGDELSGEDIIPGFACPVASIFPPRRAARAAEAAPVA